MSAVSFRRRRSVSPRGALVALSVLVMFVSLPVMAQCDPAGVQPPWFDETEVPIELELFKDEVAARGVCTSESGVVRFNDQVQSMLEASQQQSASLVRVGDPLKEFKGIFRGSMGADEMSR